MHLSVPVPHLPVLRVPTLAMSRLPAATVLLSVLYAAALAVALAAPGHHAVAGCAVLAGLVSRTVVRRRRSSAAALTVATATVDSVVPGAVLVGAVPADGRTAA